MGVSRKGRHPQSHMSTPSMRRARSLALHLAPCNGELTFVSETENVKHEKIGRVAILTLVRTKALNALCNELMADLGAALKVCEADESCGCIILTGAGRAFAAGADIKEMKPNTCETMNSLDPFAAWSCLADCRLPVIAAVNGFAFGGGCEIAMMCDIILASEKAVFGKPKAMALILTGRNMSAAEAEKAGLAAEVVPADQLMPTALKMANEIAGFGRVSTILGKEGVNSAYETALKTGVQY